MNLLFELSDTEFPQLLEPGDTIAGSRSAAVLVDEPAFEVAVFVSTDLSGQYERCRASVLKFHGYRIPVFESVPLHSAR